MQGRELPVTKFLGFCKLGKRKHGSISYPQYNLFTRRRARKDYKRSVQRQVSDEVLKNVQAKSEN